MIQQLESGHQPRTGHRADQHLDTGPEPLPLAVEPESEGAEVGPYVAAVEVRDTSGDATYGVVQESFELRHGVFLPLVLRSYS